MKKSYYARLANRLRAKRWRLNQKYIALGNDGYVYDSPKITEIMGRITQLDKQMSDLRIGLAP